MARDDWCRRTTWSEQDQAEFFARNSRSRSSDSKAQHMRIQAQSLLETRKPSLVQSAFELIRRACTDHPDALDRAWALEIAGECCEFLGRQNEAIEYYLQAIQHERKMPGIRSNAAFRLAKVVVENRRYDLYTAAVDAAEAHGAPVFPWHAYYLNGIRSVVASEKGAAAEARAYAQVALKAATIRNTGLSHDRGHLGIVSDRHCAFHKIVTRIADA